MNPLLQFVKNWQSTPGGHTGSWYGLKDRGYTEAVGNFFGAPTTDQGGSNLWGHSSANSGTLGVQSPQPMYNSPAGPQRPYNPGYTNSTNGGSTPPGTTAGIDPFQQQIESAFGAKMDFLNSAESRLRGDLPGVEAGINQQFNTSKNTLDTQNAAATRELATQETQGTQRKEDARTSARRLYDELVRGGAQRFGGASSAGEAYQALAGRELQRNNQEIATNFSNFMGQIANAKQSLEERYTNALMTLDTQKNQMLTRARSEFQDKLAQIDQLRAGAVEDKVNARLQALQDLRNQIFQINLAEAQGRNSIDEYRRQVEAELASATQAFGQSQQQGYQANQSFGANVPGTYSTDLTFNQNPTSNQFAYTGIRDEEDEDLLQGRIIPQTPRDIFA